jgi:hypothetical protein
MNLRPKLLKIEPNWNKLKKLKEFGTDLIEKLNRAEINWKTEWNWGLNYWQLRRTEINWKNWMNLRLNLLKIETDWNKLKKLNESKT